MVTAAAILQDLHRRGCRVWAAGGRLHAAPAAAIDPALHAAVGEHRDEILALIQETTWEELLRRVDIFAAGLLAGGTPETVRLPGAVPSPGLCRYCGTLPLSDLYAGRCDTCAEALWHAVGRAYRQGWRPTL